MIVRPSRPLLGVLPLKQPLGQLFPRHMPQQRRRQPRVVILFLDSGQLIRPLAPQQQRKHGHRAGLERAGGVAGVVRKRVRPRGVDA